jgi:hypothetical protein
MSRFIQTTSESRSCLTRCTMIGALVVALTMPPTDALASGMHFSTGEKLLIGSILFVGVGTAVGSGVVLISNAIDLFDEPEPTAWNVGWDLGLAVSNGVFCRIGAVNVNPQDDGKVNLTIAACTASALLLSHGIWEWSLLGDIDSSEDSSQESASLSFGPTLLDNQGSWGLGMVGTF